MAVGKRRFAWALRPGGIGTSAPDHAGDVGEDPSATGAGEPVDMAQVRADDAFVEALAKAGRTPEADPLDEQMASLLLSWRDDVNTGATRPLVDLETAVAAVRNAPCPINRQVFGPLAAAAAVLVIAFTGIGLAARGAEPGNPLFGVTKVLYSEEAQSAEAAVAVRTKLEVASEALASGRVDDAEAAIAQAQAKLPAISAEDGQGDLVALTEQLIAELSKLTPTTTPVPTITSSPVRSEPPVPPAVSSPPSEPPAESPVVTTTPVPPTVPPSTGGPEPTGPSASPAPAPVEGGDGGGSPVGTGPAGTLPDGAPEDAMPPTT